MPNPRLPLPDATRLGGVRLQIANLDRSVTYYTTVLGFRVLHRDSVHAVLAAHGSDRALIELRERAGALPAPRRGVTGLYHFAILLPDRASLARFVQHLDEINAQAGAADHLVSEAFYLQDPDNLGIEVYADRPRDTWTRANNELRMASDPIDMAGLLAAAGNTPWSGMPAGTVVGHVHLHVGDIARAAAFYGDALGFDTTVSSYPGARFLSAGGYHHHLGLNIWAGAGATTPPEQNAQLLDWTIEVPNADHVAAIEANLQRDGHAPHRDIDDALLARDPWGTPVRIVVQQH